MFSLKFQSQDLLKKNKHVFLCLRAFIGSFRLVYLMLLSVYCETFYLKKSILYVSNLELMINLIYYPAYYVNVKVRSNFSWSLGLAVFFSQPKFQNCSHSIYLFSE